jgi:hypothetical protein
MAITMAMPHCHIYIYRDMFRTINLEIAGLQKVKYVSTEFHAGL